MLFRSAIKALTALVVAQSVCADVTSDQVVATIQSVTSISQSLSMELITVDASMSFSQITGIATMVTSGFGQIVSSVTNAVTMIGSTAPFNDDGAMSVATVLFTFVEIHQDLLATVIGKHSIFAQFELTAPFTAILRSLEAGVDAFAIALIRLIPTQQTPAHNDFLSLDVSVSNCIQTYSQLCIPSPLYPKIGPICVSVGG